MGLDRGHSEGSLIQATEIPQFGWMSSATSARRAQLRGSVRGPETADASKQDLESVVKQKPLRQTEEETREAWEDRSGLADSQNYYLIFSLES